MSKNSENPGRQGGLPYNWKSVNPILIKHQHTCSDIISQQNLTGDFPDQECQRIGIVSQIADRDVQLGEGR